MDRTPLLGHDTSNDDGHRPVKSRSSFSFMNAIRSVLMAPNQTAHECVVMLLNEEDAERKDQLTEKWRNHKLEELNFIGVVGALLATVLTSTGSWPTVLANGNRQPWPCRAFWYCGILFALAAVLVAAQQTIRLHRLSAHPHGLAYIRSCLFGRRRRDGLLVPNKLQIYAWQASVMMLTVAVACMVTGMMVLVWVSTNWGPYKNPRDNWWDENAKLAVTFTAVAVATLAVLMMTQISLSVELRTDV